MDRDLDRFAMNAALAADADLAAEASETELARVSTAIGRARGHLLSLQAREGFWCAELEANTGLDAQWILCRRYLGLQEPERDRRLLARIRRAQRPDGGWNLYDEAPSDLSISIQAYFAGKLCGHSPDEPWMARARAFIHARGGIERSSVINKIYLALFDQYRWHKIPAMPVTVMLLPLGTAFNIYEMSYWARTCVVPLCVLYHQKRKKKLSREQGIHELYVAVKEPAAGRRRSEPALSWRSFFRQADKALKVLGKVPLRFHRERALRKAERWILDHQDEDGGWGGIFPAMTHALMALHALGHSIESAPIRKGLGALRALEIEDGETTRIQPCVSPVWDTAWAVMALARSGLGGDHAAVERGARWLYSKQILRKGDWAVKCPDTPPGGWAFQFHNDHYPDTDDSSAVLMALLHGDVDQDPTRRRTFERGIAWLLGLQNEDGGWGAFEKGNDREIWNEIPFNDARNMLDPSTADVTGRCVEVLGRLGYPRSHPALAAGVRYLKRVQEKDGSWWGRWGVNYIYGTWSALAALRAVQEPLDSPAIVRAAEWLCSVQNEDGGFGESCRSYEDGPPGRGPSAASQTAWAILGLCAAGRAGSDAGRRAVEWLLRHQEKNGEWLEPWFTGTGFPGVFYLRYHYYRLYFPLLALARYREAVG